MPPHAPKSSTLETSRADPPTITIPVKVKTPLKRVKASRIPSRAKDILFTFFGRSFYPTKVEEAPMDAIKKNSPAPKKASLPPNYFAKPRNATSLTGRSIASSARRSAASSATSSGGLSAALSEASSAAGSYASVSKFERAPHQGRRILGSKIYPRANEYLNRSPVSDAKPKFNCVLCYRPFKTKNDWKRHEELIYVL